MKRLKPIVVVLWALALMFFLVSFSFIPEGQIREFFTGVIISACLGFWGWHIYEKKPKEAVRPTTIVNRKPSIPPMPKITITTSAGSCFDDNEDEDLASNTVTATAQKLSTIKTLKSFENYVVIDFETTGLSAKSDKAIEVACLKIVSGESYEYQTLIDPQVHISSRITKITGITDADVSGCPTIISVARQLHDFCGNLPLVAHNASFDMGFLKQAYIKAGIEANLFYVDTLKLARSAFPEYNTHKLGFLIQELCLAEKQTHRAMDDVQCTKKLLDMCISKIIEQKQTAQQNRKNAASVN